MTDIKKHEEYNKRWKGNIVQRLFGDLVSLSYSVIQSYRSDLYHDAMFLKDTFHDHKISLYWWSVGDCGTHLCHSYERLEDVPWIKGNSYRHYKHFKIEKVFDSSLIGYKITRVKLGDV